MPSQVLVPLETQKLFERLPPLNLQPLFYRLLPEPFPDRFRRQLKRRSTNRLDRIIEIIGDREAVTTTIALWLSPAVRLLPLEIHRLLDRMPRLKWVYSQITGTDHLDLSLFAERGIAVSNSGDLSSRRMAEMALALILAHAKKLPQHFALQQRRRWQALPCDELYRQTVGIIGTGNIARELAALCKGIGLRVIAASREPTKFSGNTELFQVVFHLHTELELLLADADHVVLALPLCPETRGLLDATRLRRMKPTASLINLARGALVNELDLCDALAKGIIGAAYVDLPMKFPPSVWSRLYRIPNMMLTHNSAAKSERVPEEAFERFVSGVHALILSGSPPDRVI